VHSTSRKKRRQASAGIEPHRGPTHTRLGNPFPVGLQPVVIDEKLQADTDVEASWSQKDYDPGLPQPYLYAKPPPCWPQLNLYPAERSAHETEEQYAIYRSYFERFTNTHAVLLGLCQEFCSLLGNHRTCAEGVCRRNGACSGIRDQGRYWLPLLVYPPCVPLDREIMETYREEVLTVFNEWEALQRKPHPAAPPVAPSRKTA